MDFRTPNSNVPVFPDYTKIVCWICTEKTNHNIIKYTNQHPKRNYIQRAVSQRNDKDTFTKTTLIRKLPKVSSDGQEKN